MSRLLSLAFFCTLLTLSFFAFQPVDAVEQIASQSPQASSLSIGESQSECVEDVSFAKKKKKKGKGGGGGGSGGGGGGCPDDDPCSDPSKQKYCMCNPTKNNKQYKCGCKSGSASSAGSASGL